MTNLIPITVSYAPALVVAAGDRARTRFWEFFVSNIRNPHKRRAYARAVQDFLAWCEQHGVRSIPEVEQIHVASYIWTSALG